MCVLAQERLQNIVLQSISSDILNFIFKHEFEAVLTFVDFCRQNPTRNFLNIGPIVARHMNEAKI